MITATSAAALAIQATGSNTSVHWLVTSFYSAALGLSLQGLVLVTYMTILAGGSSDEAIGRLARGELIPTGKLSIVRPVAFIIALPAILSTYSSIFLLAGLVAMVVKEPGEGTQARRREFIIATITPVGLGFLCLLTTVAFCEIGSWIEIRQRRGSKKQYRGAGSPGDETSEAYCCSYPWTQSLIAQPGHNTACSSRTSLTVSCLFRR